MVNPTVVVTLMGLAIGIVYAIYNSVTHAEQPHGHYGGGGGGGYGGGLPPSDPRPSSRPSGGAGGTGKKRKNEDDRTGKDIDKDCSICREELFRRREDRVILPVETPCHHFYHRECIEQWIRIQTSCPQCRLAFPRSFIASFLARS